MAQTRTTCPKCRQPVVVDLNQLFDVNANPEAKQQLLSGSYNLIQCKTCGFEGNLPSPIVYHDSEKELLLTYFPPELGLPVNEQERMLGPFITQITNKLPMEKRKAYLLRPQTMFTMQTMVEKILEADGITKEMLQAQQQRMNLLQRLVGASEDVLVELIKQEDKLIDEEFFAILGQLMQIAMSSGNQETVDALGHLQQHLMEHSTGGQKLARRSQEAELAIKSLQEAGKNGGLTREILVDLVISAPNEDRVIALATLAHTGMDYQFFQILSEKIDAATGEEYTRLAQLRDLLLKITGDIQKAIQKQVEDDQTLLEKLINAANTSQATAENLGEISESFLELLKAEMQMAKAKSNMARMEKLQMIAAVTQQASTPPEIALIQELIQIPDDNALQQAFQAHREEITPEFLQMFNGLISQMQANQQDPRVIDRLQKIYKAALRFSMEQNFRNN